MSYSFKTRIICQEGNVKIKVIIILVLKLDSEVNSEQGLGHRSGESAQADSSQYKNKSYYYHGLKTKLEGQLE